jgi:hypothetical protein
VEVMALPSAGTRTILPMLSSTTYVSTAESGKAEIRNVEMRTKRME